MQKVDWAIAGVGAVALVATVLGIVFYEDAVGEETYVFPETSQAIAADPQTRTGSGAMTFSIPMPDNATAVEDLAVTVSFTGNAGLNPSGGSYTVRVTTPNGTVCQGQPSQAWSTGDVTVEFGDCRWRSPPQPMTAADPGAINETVAWTDNLQIVVEVQGPTATNVPNVHSYSYRATVSGSLLSYQAQREVPDPDAAR